MISTFFDYSILNKCFVNYDIQENPYFHRDFLVYSVRLGRIELPTNPWQGLILPLNHSRNLYFIDQIDAFQPT